MSQHLILLSYGMAGGAAPPASGAQVLARTLYTFGTFSANCAVQHFTANGVCHQRADTGGSDYNWKLSGANSDYDILATKTGGTTVPTFSAGWANNSWMPLTADRTFYINQTVAGILTANVNVSIRYNANSTVIMTAAHYLTAEAKK